MILPVPRRHARCTGASLLLLISLLTLTPGVARSGPVEALRFGLLDHATTVTSSGIENGIDANIELRFDEALVPTFIPFSPYPVLGASFNFDASDTDQIYAGLTWEWMITDGFFAHLGGGLAIHNGELHRDPNDHQRALGQRVLFRASIELGRRFGRHHSLAIAWDHISNGPLNGPNLGLETLGLRYTYFFQAFDSADRR